MLDQGVNINFAKFLSQGAVLIYALGNQRMRVKIGLSIFFPFFFFFPLSASLLSFPSSFHTPILVLN